MRDSSLLNVVACIQNMLSFVKLDTLSFVAIIFSIIAIISSIVLLFNVLKKEENARAFGSIIALMTLLTQIISLSFNIYINYKNISTDTNDSNQETVITKVIVNEPFGHDILNKTRWRKRDLQDFLNDTKIINEKVFTETEVHVTITNKGKTPIFLQNCSLDVYFSNSPNDKYDYIYTMEIMQTTDLSLVAGKSYSIQLKHSQIYDLFKAIRRKNQALDSNNLNSIQGGFQLRFSWTDDVGNIYINSFFIEKNKLDLYFPFIIIYTPAPSS